MSKISKISKISQSKMLVSYKKQTFSTFDWSNWMRINSFVADVSSASQSARLTWTYKDCETAFNKPHLKWKLVKASHRVLDNKFGWCLASMSHSLSLSLFSSLSFSFTIAAPSLRFIVKCTEWPRTNLLSMYALNQFCVWFFPFVVEKRKRAPANRVVKPV